MSINESHFIYHYKSLAYPDYRQNEIVILSGVHQLMGRVRVEKGDEVTMVKEKKAFPPFIYNSMLMERKGRVMVFNGNLIIIDKKTGQFSIEENYLHYEE